MSKLGKVERDGEILLVCSSLTLLSLTHFLVCDCQDQLHFELTVFGKEAAARVEKKTVEGYLRAVPPFFTYLEPYYLEQALAKTSVVLVVNAPHKLFEVYQGSSLIK